MSPNLRSEYRGSRVLEYPQLYRLPELLFRLHSGFHIVRGAIQRQRIAYASPCLRPFRWVPLDLSLLTGQTESYLCSDSYAVRVGAPVHAEVVGPFLRLQEDARQEGFDLRILSGFRSFERQLSIWNRKVRGELPVLDSDAQPLEISRLGEEELVLQSFGGPLSPGHPGTIGVRTWTFSMRRRGRRGMR